MGIELTAMYERIKEGSIAAWVVEIPGVASQGRTYKEARENLRKELNAIFQARREYAYDQIRRNPKMRREILEDA